MPGKASIDWWGRRIEGARGGGLELDILSEDGERVEGGLEKERMEEWGREPNPMAVNLPVKEIARRAEGLYQEHRQDEGNVETVLAM